MKKLPPSAADSWAASPTAAEVMKAVPRALSSAGSAKSMAVTGRAPFTWVSPPDSQASSTTIRVSACEAAVSRRSSS